MGDLPYRSLLIVPGDRPEQLLAALSSAADAVIADLEDLVAPERKDEARATVADAFNSPADTARLVRVNAPETGLATVDLDAIAGLELDALVVPKATPEAILEFGAAGPPIVAIVESAAGLRCTYETASMPRVAALVLGANDLARSLRLEQRPDAVELLYARSKLVADSAAAGIRAPFDRVYPRRGDPEGLDADARFARSLGFGGKVCIEPVQTTVVNDAFGPSASTSDRSWSDE